MTQPPYISSTEVRCVGCGYDLSGTPVGGTCPECGRPVRDTLNSKETGDKSCGNATASMIFGILSLTVCGLLGLVAIGLAHAADKEMAAGGYSSTSHTMAKAGWIMGWISTAILAIVGFFFLFAAILS